MRNDGESVVVGRIVRGGVAERSGLLHEGDEILEVNGVEVRGKSINDVCDLVASMTGTITFLIVPAASLAVKPVIAANQPNVVSATAEQTARLNSIQTDITESFAFLVSPLCDRFTSRPTSTTIPRTTCTFRARSSESAS